jgi:hypothetical protein
MPGADEWNNLLSHVGTMVQNAPSDLNDVSQFQDFEKGAGDLQNYASQLQNAVQQHHGQLGNGVSNAADGVAGFASDIATKAQALSQKAAQQQLTENDRADVEHVISQLQDLPNQFPELGSLF